tara:strand:- start:235 stop:471 length:237 start_codon:yes stop_codon:yes gene_type:complete
MSKYQFFMGRFIIALCAIIIGIPLGILFATVNFFRALILFPLQMYTIAVDKWERRVQIEQADIWTRHVDRMKEKADLN